MAKTTIKTSAELALLLDKELNVSAFEDSSHNGLQVANSGRVGCVCCGVDATVPFFERAAAKGAGVVICHHGISWGDSLARITEMNYAAVSYLIQHDIALYACHLPLDAHPRLGNNAQICRALGLTKLKPFGEYNGSQIGFEGMLPRAMKYESFKRRVATVTGGELRTMDFGPETVRRVAVVSGGAAAEVLEAGRKGIDVYVTGEPALQAYHTAEAYGISAIFAGHYATEVFGVRAVGAFLERRCGLAAEFINMEIPY